MQVLQILATAHETLLTIGSDAPLTRAAKLLGDGGSNLLVVCDVNGRMVGIVTKTDIIRRISACQGCACTFAVSSVMTRDICYCRPNDRVEDVWRTMRQRGLRVIPVVGQHFEPLAVISARDALQTLLVNADQQETLLREYVMGYGYH